MDNGKYFDGDGQFQNAPYFNFNDDQVKFNTRKLGNFNDNYGSVSGAVPKSLLCQLQKAFNF